MKSLFMLIMGGFMAIQIQAQQPATKKTEEVKIATSAQCETCKERIEKALYNSDSIIVCLSPTSVSKEGFVQKEFKFAIDKSLEMTEGGIFLIPVRLSECQVPLKLSKYHWVDLFVNNGYKKLIKGLRERSNQIGIKIKENDPQEEISDVLKNSFLFSKNTFEKTRPPIVTVTGASHSGKSTLINCLFGSKIWDERMTLPDDTSGKIVRVKFPSGLIIFDTPGVGGAIMGENSTRAFFNLPQITVDMYGNSVNPIAEVGIVDPSTYDPSTNSPIEFISPHQSPHSDLILFVIDINSGVLNRWETQFFSEINKTGCPVAVVINKIDSVDEETIKSGCEKVNRLLNRKAVPISAGNNINIDNLLSVIIRNLPATLTNALFEMKL